MNYEESNINLVDYIADDGGARRVSGNVPSAEMIYKHSPAPSGDGAVTPEVLNGRRGFTAVGSETKMPEVR